MLKKILVLIFFAGSVLSSTICLASTDQALEAQIQVVAIDDSLNGASINKLEVTDGTAKVKTSKDVPRLERGDDISAQTSFFMLLLSLLGFIALSNRRNV